MILAVPVVKEPGQTWYALDVREHVNCCKLEQHVAAMMPISVRRTQCERQPQRSPNDGNLLRLVQCMQLLLKNNDVSKRDKGSQSAYCSQWFADGVGW